MVGIRPIIEKAYIEGLKIKANKYTIILHSFFTFDP